MALLEEAAWHLYREWFVRLRFPGHERTRIIDGVPEEWERLATSDLADFINGFAFKPAHLGDVGLPISKIPEYQRMALLRRPRERMENLSRTSTGSMMEIYFSTGRAHWR